MRRIATLITLTALGATAIAGCGDDGGKDTGLTTSDVAGRYYVATKVTGHTLVPGSTISLSFNDTEQLSASSGCNAILGIYQIKSGILRMNPTGATTMMACVGPLQQQEEWLRSLLKNGVHIAAAADGGLTLTQGDVRIDLKDSPEGGAGRSGPPPIVGTAWKLRQVVEGDGKAGPAVPAASPPTLEFTSSGRALVYTGCNRGGADVEVRDDGFIVFGRLSLTRMACRGNAAALEKEIAAVLRGKVAAGFEGNDLSLVRDGTRLVYTAP